MNRREFLTTASAGAALIAGANQSARAKSPQTQAALSGDAKRYKYRIAFGAWINDMRSQPLPLENWPAPQFDDDTIDSAIRAMDVQSDAGFNMLDAWGLFSTYGWPADIVSAITDDRRKRVNQLLEAAKRRNITYSMGTGTYSWGYDEIIKTDPQVAGKNPDGSPSPHAMCDGNPKSFEYVKKIIDATVGQFECGAVHLESCDLGCCWCPKCAGKDGVVGYNVRINQKTADYIKSKWPEKTVYVITINWCPPGKHFNAEEKAHLIELSKHVDCIFDQGHCGYHIDPAERREFLKQLHCAYGTSGHLWLYPDARWDRDSYFLPYPKRTGEAIRSQFEDGVRGCLYYQGPVRNAGTELMVAFGGRMLSDPSKNVDDALSEALARYYKPTSEAAMKRLMNIVHTAEESYFTNWSAELFQKVWGIPVPGEFKLDQRLFGTSPGPATFLKEPMLDAKGRKEYRKGIASILAELPKLAPDCRDDGRLARINKSLIITLNMLNTVSYCLNEPTDT